jgi:hypothetical protein
MEDFVVTCPLVPDVPHLISGSYSAPHTFGLGFLQTPDLRDAAKSKNLRMKLPVVFTLRG